ncbi:MAG: 2-amino-4-hydroxy-6-hydroxymethyldihydropteridine diphosphokinase [Deltaproteobacteria bacterium]|jgi:2-amino-4-hydroxy-6-hydroxymethyldihydropteridine diphosphokinase|nr:2-amino-4-hydroxy-6-hydroxymethyldihydropteridine diphosphokinase [Deltaproteobacteria bacterium]
MAKRVLVAIALGANLDRPAYQLGVALELISVLPGVSLVNSSKIRQTEPVGGPPGQNPYLNQVLLAQVKNLTPKALLNYFLDIETVMGRVRNVPNGPRIIDIDLLLWGDKVIDKPGLIVPHPRMAEREFVLQPLVDVYPYWVHPILGYSANELLDRLPLIIEIDAPKIEGLRPQKTRSKAPAAQKNEPSPAQKSPVSPVKESPVSPVKESSVSPAKKSGPRKVSPAQKVKSPMSRPKKAKTP